MGYSAEQFDSDFFIASVNVGGAYESLSKAYAKRNRNQPVPNTFSELMKEYGFTIYTDGRLGTGNVRGVTYDRSRFFDSEMTELVGTIAPYVANNSFIDFHGEDDTYWRYLFKHGKVFELIGRVEFDYSEVPD